MDFKNNYKFKCSIDDCQASFKKQCLLDIHLRKHSSERPFVCDVPDCQKSYTNVVHLKRHVAQVHEKEDEVMCDIEGCGMVLSSRYHLKKHKIRSHIETSFSFSCLVCPQKFHKRWQLNQHSRSHSGKPLFTCTVCNIGFYQLHLYNKHKRSHKTFTCDCGEEFGKWTIFCEHRRNSCTIKKIDHKCIICNKIFTTKMNLTQHSLKVHLEESQNTFHHCPYSGCKRGYKYKKNLTAHISTIHEKVAEEFSIECTEPGCGTIFKSQRNLRRHLINIHQGAKKANIKKARRPRKDKGKHKKCMASILSGVELSSKENLDIINKRARTQTKLENSIENDSKDMSEANKEYKLSESILTYQEKSNGNLQASANDSKDTSEANKEDKLSESILTYQEKSNGNFQAVANDGLDSEDNLLQLCNEMMSKIQECMEQTPLQAKQELRAHCEIKV